MGTAPNGYNTPKTNWQANNVPLASDFNRIEGNIQAIEGNNRTIDPTQVPTSNVGSLRQFLDWFANRIKAITGENNWYDTPVITIKDLNTYVKGELPQYDVKRDINNNILYKSTPLVSNATEVSISSSTTSLIDVTYNLSTNKTITIPSTVAPFLLIQSELSFSVSSGIASEVKFQLRDSLNNIIVEIPMNTAGISYYSYSWWSKGINTISGTFTVWLVVTFRTTGDTASITVWNRGLNIYESDIMRIR
jgi:hypothetical protein